MAKGPRSRPSELDEVLQGRRSPSVAELFGLVHDVNPTSRDVTPRQKAERYATKARLLCILVARHADELVVERDSDDLDIVLLRRRARPDDVTHARLSELDDHARSALRARLDARDDEGVETSGAASHAAQRARRSAGADPLFEARAALEEYDYERAEALLLEAPIERSVEAARALLELYVDLLGRDADAVALAPRLEAEVAADATVRGLLALAAARGGDPTRARRLLSGASESYAAEAVAHLASQALGRGALDDAARLVDELALRSPGHPSLPRCTAELAQLRAAARRPLEASLEAALAAGDTARARAEATALLAAWPDSPVARRALEALEDAETRRRVDALRAEAEARVAARDPGRAVELLTEARAIAPADLHGELDRAARDAEAVRRAADDERAVERIVATLANVAERELLEYSELGERVRAEVRRRLARPELEWLERLGAPQTKAQARAAVPAVLALRAARECADEPTRALELLLAHEVVLAPLDVARALLRDLRARLVVERSAASLRALAVARAALAEGRLDDAEQALRAVDRSTLSPVAQAEAAALATEHERRATVERQSRAYATTHANGALFEARTAVDRLLELCDAGDRPTWLERRRALTEAIEHLWRVERFDGASDEDAAALALDDDARVMTEEYADVSVSLEAGELYRVTVAGRWAFVRTASLDSGRVRSAVVLRAPVSLERARLTLDGDVAWLVAPEGLIALSRGRGEVVAFHELAKWVSPDEEPDDAHVLPGGRFALLEATLHPRHELVSRLIDLERQRIHRELPTGTTALCHLPASRETPVAVVGEHAVTFWTRGGVAVGHRFDVGDGLGVVPHPTRASSVLVLERVEEDDRVPVRVREVTASGQLTAGCELEDSSWESQHVFATSLEEGLTFFVQSGTRATSDHDAIPDELVAFVPRGDGLDLRLRAPVPRATCLATDPEHRAVFAVATTTAGFEVHRLGATPPVFRGGGSGPRCLPHASELALCGAPTGDARAPIEKLRSRALSVASSERARWARSYVEQHSDDPDALITAAYAFGSMFDVDRELARRRAVELHPHHADVRLLRAEQHASAREWDAVLELLGGDESLPQQSVRAEHFLHVLGVAAFHLGRLDVASHALERAQRVAGGESSCQLDRWLELTEVHAGRRTEGRVASIVARVRAAKARLDAGEVEAARTLLDDREAWASEDFVTTMLRAQAYLEPPLPVGAKRFRALRAAAVFVHEADDRRACLVSGPVPSDATVARLVQAADAFLEALHTEGDG